MSMFGTPQASGLAQARALAQQGRTTDAMNAYTAFLEQSPDDVEALCGLGDLHLQSGGYLEARELFERASKQQPENDRILVRQSRTYAAEGRMGESRSLLEKALELNPENSEARRAMAELHRMQGEYREAYDLLKGPVESGEADIYALLSFSRVAHRFEGIERSIEIAKEVSEYEGVAPHFIWNACYMLGGYYDQAKRYDEAFEAYAKANRLSRKPFNVNQQVERFEATKRVWTREAADAIPDSGNDSELPVFVVGMPRSGTTLVERIIGAHPDAFPGGERHELVVAARDIVQENGNFMSDPSVLAQGDLAAHAERILESFRDASQGDVKRFVDKVPTNTLRLNLIAKLFPKAKIIRMRRDPRDTCLSCYFHAFTGAHPYTYDLTDLGTFYPAYESMATHYIETLGLDALTVPYEELVADQEGWSRKIIDHVGLDWHEDVLRFHEKGGTAVTSSNEQVRREIYTSSAGRWKNYEKHLGPLLEALGDHAPS